MLALVSDNATVCTACLYALLDVQLAIDCPRQLKCDEYTYLHKKHEPTALHNYQPRAKALSNNYLCAPTVEMED